MIQLDKIAEGVRDVLRGFGREDKISEFDEVFRVCLLGCEDKEAIAFELIDFLEEERESLGTA